MGLFSKDEKVPEIPVAPALPQFPSSGKKDLPELPSFPASSKNENFNQEMVKSAVADMPSPGEKEMNMEASKDLHISEEPSEELIIPPKPSENLIPDLPRKPLVVEMPRETLKSSSVVPDKLVPKEIEPIFVRIDKFQTAQKNFEQIKTKIDDIESIVGKIKDVKSREEAELKSWTEDIEKIKSRLAEIDAGIFNQI